MIRAIFALCALSAAAVAAPALALDAKQHVLKRVVETAPDGEERVRYVPADLVIPGETVVYALVFHNNDQVPAEDIVLVMPVPPEVVYIENSAERSFGAPDYSVDGGETFAPRDALRVADANDEMREASAEDITHLRWKVDKPIAPGESGQLAFHGTLK